MARKMTKCTKCGYVLIACGILMLVVGIAGLYTIGGLINSLIDKSIVIKPGSSVYDQWKEPTVPIVMEIYAWNLTNPEEFFNGKIPKFEQVGPFVYTEKRIKWDIKWMNDIGTVRYKQNRTFFFDPENSVANDSTKLFTANIPLITIGQVVKRGGFIAEVLVSLLLRLFPNEKAYRGDKSVRDYVWGYEDEMLAKAKSIAPSFVPTSFVGIMTGNNNSYDGTYEIITGVKDVAETGKIVTFNDTNVLKFWKTYYANMINGSDTTVWPPHLTTDTRLYGYVSDICRSVYMDYIESYHTDLTKKANINDDVELYRYSSTAWFFKNWTINHDNIGFCVPDTEHCTPGGLLDLSICKSVNGFSLPIASSQPHFLYADEKIFDTMEGMSPDPKQHASTIDIEPQSGIMFEANKRLQINVHVEKISGFSQLGNIKPVYFPLIWINESMHLNRDVLEQLHSQMFLPKKISHYGLWTLAIVGAIVVAVTSILLITRVVCLVRSQYEELDDSNYVADYNYNGSIQNATSNHPVSV